ncbi:hypothetical protein FNF29_01506 [Cafeteria roenbergensis]|uniref:Uncharacterized protein n=1 Tax=Cafeteria roenbergensis TaxID=33653 RepID=A0A5A8CSE6_CAFRO|nr:hypothetical protein FNF29_01506 [Cafeteria roenbergensis]|eukprot:KAA0155589.1 hypothetical protein FNF29_01506 [Cafeteria roenbergensis]
MQAGRRHLPRFWLGLQTGSPLADVGVLSELLRELTQTGAAIGLETAPFDGTGRVDEVVSAALRASGVQQDNVVVSRLVGIVDGDAARRAALLAEFGPEAVTVVDETTSSCLAPAFVEREAVQASETLGRPLDLLMVVNPEDFVVGRINRSDPLKAGEDKQKWDSELRGLLRDSFGRLNSLCEKGVLGGYGVSSEALEMGAGPAALHPNTITAAAAAAASKGPGQSATGFLRCVAMPGNLVERRAWRAVAQWAHDRSLGLLLTRPLTARDPTGAPLPLDDGGSSHGSEDNYDQVRAEAASWFVPPAEDEWPSDYSEADRADVVEAVEFMASFLNQLHEALPGYTSPLHWEKDLATQVAPVVRDRLAEVDETSASLIARFLDAYGRRVRITCQRRTRQVVSDPLGEGGLGYGATRPPWPGVRLGAEEPLQDFAGRWCGAVVQTGEADGVVLHAATAEEAERMLAAIQSATVAAEGGGGARQ